MIVTLAMLKHYLQVDEIDVTNDTFYTELLTRAQAWVESKIDYPIEQSIITDEVHDAEEIIVPLQLPITSVTLKYIASFSTTPASDVTLVANSDYYVYPNYIVLKNVGTFSNEVRRRIKISYTGGYAVAPQALIDVVLKVAAYEINLNRPLQPNEAIDQRIVKDIEETLESFMKVDI